jgi:hypothetical protein
MSTREKRCFYTSEGHWLRWSKVSPRQRRLAKKFRWMRSWRNPCSDGSRCADAGTPTGFETEYQMQSSFPAPRALPPANRHRRILAGAKSSAFSMNACSSVERRPWGGITKPKLRFNAGRRGSSATPSGTLGNEIRGTIEIPKPSRTKLTSVPRS